MKKNSDTFPFQGKILDHEYIIFKKKFLIVNFSIILNIKYKSHQFFLFFKFFDQKLHQKLKTLHSYFKNFLIITFLHHFQH